MIYIGWNNLKFWGKCKFKYVYNVSIINITLIMDYIIKNSSK